MARPAYKITEEDFSIAYKYLSKKHEGSAALMSLRVCGNGTELQDWCDIELKKSEFQKVKQVIWAERKRFEDSKKRNKSKQITISKNAWEVLKRLSEDENLSLSETIENFINPMVQMPKPERDRLVKQWNI
ncbi:MAG: hypothetical protein HRU20_32580 [Pseudomonadales bacterium]|nr:hypothetical protein [Pseudomonadales bacterium]